MMLQRNIV